jgi:hypothetical protein
MQRYNFYNYLTFYFFYFWYAVTLAACLQRDGGLATAAASTTFARGYYLSNLYFTFMRVTAGVAPNRLL